MAAALARLIPCMFNTQLELDMKHVYKTILLAMALQATSFIASAQTEIQLKDGKKIGLTATHFAIRPVNCNVVDCAPKKKIMLKDICMTAICLPVEAKDIPRVLGPDVLHWRVSKSRGTMTQFVGDRPLGDVIKASAPPILAKAEDIKALPIIGLANTKGQVSQYWVWTK